MKKRGEIYYKNVFIQIFRDHWERFRELHPEYVSDHVEENVEKMMGCGLISNGYFEYRCLGCGEKKVVGFTCKSRFCLRCVKVYIDKWVEKMRERVFKWVSHRHVILTVPGVLWEYFRDPDLLKRLAESGVETIKEVVVRSNKGVGVDPGVVGVIQTSGRASTWNPHLHFLVTEGGLDKEGRWHDVRYFDYELLRKIWMYKVLKLLREAFPDDKGVQDKISDIYRRRSERGFIIRAKKERVRKRDIVSYLIKYVASPPIALSRIVGYDGEEVRYWYREHPTERRVEVRVSAFEFIRRMIQHIMPKQFRMVRHYGLYCRNKVSRVGEVLGKLFDGVRGVVQEFHGLLTKVKSSLSFRERMRESFGKDPFVCSRCGGELELFRIWHPRYGEIYHVRDDPRYEVIEDGQEEEEKPQPSEEQQLSLWAV